MNKKGELSLVFLATFVMIIFIVFAGFVIALTIYEGQLKNKLDKCVSNNYDPYEKEYNYNSIIKCCIRLDYREAYCLERFKPGYKDHDTKG